ncbi:transglycosylase domain-containing protein [Fulvivirga sediminis]|uniref:Transglycosylase domain-containing protein n=1 Tax=Fulvivirga sediminis TaxID=2803949 RepID=A0A937FBC8_9BACT|nr:transglycosylase domain-containing protein [Fulvivirga sediminis]MBL3657750.1 transglycosylase domain-containing protein [Fulvivirga sediminis]
MDFKNIIQKFRAKSSKKSKGFKLAVLALWIFFFSVVILLPIYILTVNINLFGLYGGMPSLKALENPENDLSSELISADGVSLGRYFRYNRSQVTYDELSPELVNTLLSSEDHRFYKHPGIDFQGLMRAVVGKLTFNYAGGGSTITMQLAENLFNTMTENEGSLYKINGLKQLIIKTKEWMIAAHLERNFTKEEIIAMYFNTVSFGSNAYGIKAAAETFFAKQPSELNYDESAVLVGLLQGTYAFSPVYNYESSVKKRNQVLGKIYRHGHISQDVLDSLRTSPIDLEGYDVANQNKGLATYFRTVIKRDLIEWSEQNGYDLWEDGLKIYTTIDSRMQRYAEEAVTEHMSQLQKLFNDHWGDKNPWINEGKEIPNFLESRFKRTEHYRELVKKYGRDSDSLKIMMNKPRKMTVFSWGGEKDTLMSPLDSISYYKRFLQTGLMSMDPHTGHIKAWVGGIDHKYFKYDHVKQGKRQPGSTFKPFVYGTAIEQGYPPCFEVPDVMVTFNLPEGGTWTTPNSDGKYGTGEKMTIRQGMARSVNTITSYLMKEVTPRNVVDFAHRVGIESKLDEVPSLCLGVSDVCIYELVGAYSTFANNGIYTKPYYITRIEDKNGNVIENFVPKTRQATSQSTAYKMLYMLRGGVEERGGTSAGIDRELKINNEVGGKTGTTNNASDGWYMGVTKDLVTGVWVGGDERSIHFRNWLSGQGGRTARPIWEKYMLKVYNDKDLSIEKGPFERPIGGIDVNLDCSRYNQSTSEDDETEEDDDSRMWDDSDFNN